MSDEREPEDRPVGWCGLHVPRPWGQDEQGVSKGSWGGRAGDGWRVVGSETDGREGPLDLARSQYLLLTPSRGTVGGQEWPH